MFIATMHRSLLMTLALLGAQAGWCQAIPGVGYALRSIDGDNDVGAHFAMVTRPGATTAFFYLADQGQLVASSCFGSTCNYAYGISDPVADRGRHVSAAPRPALTNRPIAAYYDATNGNLMAFDCTSTECQYGIERTLESVGNIGQDTATVVDPATGFPLIAYYDVDNADLRLYRCATAVCDSGSSVLVNGTNDRGHNVSMVFAGSTLWMAYEDRTSGELILARSTTPFNTFSIVSQASGAEPSLTADANGFLDMVWRETIGNTLQRLQCLNTTCSSANQGTLATAGRGFRPSSTRLPSGNLLVSHFEPGTGSMRGTLCNDLGCSAPQSLLFESSPGVAGKSLMRTTDTGLPLVFFHDALRADVRSSQCTAAACTAFTQRVAYNGFPVNGARLALRPDGRPVVAYIRQRRPWLAQCSDALCSSVSHNVVPGFNSDPRPAIAVRPDGRPVIYYSNVGGSELYDCANAACSSGNSRTVSGSGNFTGDVIEMTLRADGRPVLLYTVSNANDVFVFDCADVNCSSGTARLLADEPTASGTFLSSFAIIVGPGDRPIVMYSFFSNGGNQLRYVRCNDSACTAATAINVGSNVNFYGTPLALRNDGRPAFLETSAGNYVVCDNADCTGVARFPTATGSIVRTLALKTGDRPIWESSTTGMGIISACEDATCSTLQQNVVLTDSNPQSSYLGSLALAPSGSAYAAFEEQSLGDVVLVVPLPDAIFGSGFE
jgi:hypothetical protein